MTDTPATTPPLTQALDLVDPGAERTPLSAQVARHLLELVARERLMPGDGVPSEVQLAKDLQVSRGSVREAYRTLAALGILSIENGKRPRLQSIRAEGLAQVFGYALTIAQVHMMHVIDTRRGIEVHGAQLAAQFATPSQKAQMQVLVGEMRASLQDKSHRRRILADIGIHTLLAEASRNPLNVLLLGALRTPLEQSMDVDLGSRRSPAELARIVDAHALIVERVCAGDPVGAGAAMTSHFDMSLASMPRVPTLPPLETAPSGADAARAATLLDEAAEDVARRTAAGWIAAS
jgi:DNA-binding FadR family transcriptional regulator